MRLFKTLSCFRTLSILTLVAAWTSFAAAPDAEGLATFASDCETPKTVFAVGDSICAVATATPLGPPAQRRFEWVAPDGTIFQLGPDIVSDPQSDLLTIPSSGRFAQVGTWTVKTVNTSNNGYAVARFVVYDPGSATADLSISLFGPFQISSGSTATFTVQVSNSGPNDAQDVRLVVAPATNSILKSAEQTTGPLFTGMNPTSGSATIFAIAELPANVTASFVFVYQVDANLQGGAGISSTATVSSATPELYAADNAATVTTSVTPRPCNIVCPSNVTVSKPAGQCGSSVDYMAAGSSGDNCGRLTCSPAPGSFFPVGTSNVICFGNTGAPCSFTVTVNDSQAPTIKCPSDIAVHESSPGMGLAVVTYKPPILNDNCAAETSACTPPSGSSFPLGATTVVCETSDGAAGHATCSFSITVNGVDCTLACAANIVKSSNPVECGSLVTYPIPNAVPSCGPSTCAPPSGVFFPIGTTVVSCKSSMASSCTFTVTVQNTQTPAIYNISASPSTLPPDHKLKEVAIKYDISAGCSADTICTLTVSSNEHGAETPIGQRDVDWITVDAHHVLLRPAKSREQNGLIYAITITCTNSSGNSSSKTVMVSGAQNRR